VRDPVNSREMKSFITRNFCRFRGTGEFLGENDRACPGTLAPESTHPVPSGQSSTAFVPRHSPSGAALATRSDIKTLSARHPGF
jgi:hypothetical protein